MFNRPVEIPKITPVNVNTVLVNSNGVVSGICATKPHKTSDTEYHEQKEKRIAPDERSDVARRRTSASDVPSPWSYALEGNR